MPRIHSVLLCCLAALLAAAASRPGAAQYIDAQIEFTRQPFLPQLAVNVEPAVCERFLANLTEQFKSRQFLIDFGASGVPSRNLGSSTETLGFEIIPWADRWKATKPYAIEVDVDGDGDLDLLLQYRSHLRSREQFMTAATDDRDGFVSKADAAASLRELDHLSYDVLEAASACVGGQFPVHVFAFNGSIYGFAPPAYRQGTGVTPL